MHVFMYITCFYVVVGDPVDTTVCEGDNVTFTCVLLFPSGSFPSNPGWVRNVTVTTNIGMRETVTGNHTVSTSAPAYISGTITVSSVIVLDDGVSYQCGSGQAVSSSATLNVVGKYIFHGLVFLRIVETVCSLDCMVAEAK